MGSGNGPSAEHFLSVKRIHRDLLEKAMEMRCVAYLSNAKAQLMVDTVWSVGASKRKVMSVNARLKAALKLLEDETHSRREAELQLHQIRQAVDGAPLMFALCRAGVLEYTNEALRRAFGLDADNPPTSAYDVFIASGNTSDAEFSHAILNATPFRGELGFSLPSGDVLWGRAHITPLLGAAEEAMTVVIIEDVSKAREVEERLRQTQHLEAIGRLTEGMAHDFNNLLNVILSSAELLADAPNPEGWMEAVSNISTAARQGGALTGQLLAFARRQRLEPQSVNVNRLVTEFRSLLQGSLAERYPLTIELPAEVAVARCDPTKLKAAILNLVVNARDASGPGGRIVLRVGLQEVRDEAPWPGAHLKPMRYVTIKVRDYGCGIPAEVVERVWEPFFTLKAPGMGSGLGLSMVHGFAAQSGGAATLKSSPNEGTEVQILVPCAASERNSHASPADAEGIRVLLVEDEPLLRRNVTILLRREGYHVQSTYGLSGAEQILRHGPVDVLVTDVILPHGASGLDIAKLARRLHPEVKVLFVSGHSFQVLESEGLEAIPGAEFLPKPFSRAELAGQLKELLETERLQEK